MRESEQTPKANTGNLWWIAFCFVPFIHWASLLYAGATAKNRKWLLCGLLYALPVVVLFAIIDSNSNSNTVPENIAVAFLIFSWVGSLVHSLAIRKEYLYRISRLSFDKAAPNRSYQSKGDKYHDIISEVERIKKDIFREIEKSGDYESIIINDIKSMLMNYTKQVKELIERDKKMANILDNFSLGELDKSIKQLKSSMETTENETLRNEYKTSLEKLEKHKKAYNEFADQRKVIQLRIDSSIVSLRQIKLDVMKVHNLSSDEKRREYFETFEKKSGDLSQYIKMLKENYRSDALR